jgi:hypothetical protein
MTFNWGVPITIEQAIHMGWAQNSAVSESDFVLRIDLHDLLVLSWEWIGMGVAGMIIDSYCGSFPHSLLSTSKMKANK